MLLAGSRVTGGAGGLYLGSFSGGKGGPALHFADPTATVVARGNSDDALISGPDGYFEPLNPGPTPAATGSGSLTWGGLTCAPQSFAPGIQVTQVFPGHEFQVVGGKDHPGATKRLNAFGPSGEPLLILFTFGASAYTTPEVDGAIYLYPWSTFFALNATLLGLEVPWSASVSLPPSFAGAHGLMGTFQGFTAPSLPGGKWRASNPAFILLR